MGGWQTSFDLEPEIQFNKQLNSHHIQRIVLGGEGIPRLRTYSAWTQGVYNLVGELQEYTNNYYTKLHLVGAVKDYKPVHTEFQR